MSHLKAELYAGLILAAGLVIAAATGRADLLSSFDPEPAIGGPDFGWAPGDPPARLAPPKKTPQVRIWGPEVYEIGATRTFSASIYLKRAVKGTLRAVNGRPDNTGRVTGATVRLRGKKVISGGQLGKRVGGVKKTVQLAKGRNALSVTLTGPAGSVASFYLTAPSDSLDEPPQILVLDPSGGDFSTPDAAVVFHGSASDDVKVSSVRFTNNGTAGQATGTTDWQATVPLQPGDNHITFAATDSTGQSSNSDVVVTRTTALAYDGAPGLMPSALDVNSPTRVTARVGILPNPALDASSVRLMQLDADGSPGPVVAMLRDDGNPATGDEAASDGVFSGIFDYTAPEAGPASFRVAADLTTGATNELSPISVVRAGVAPSDAEIAANLAVHDEAALYFQRAIPVMGRDLAATATTLRLRATPGIADAGATASGVWTQFANGLTTSLIDLPPDMLGGCRAELPFQVPPPLNAITRPRTPARRTVGPPSRARAATLAIAKPTRLLARQQVAEAESRVEVGSHRALLLAPFFDLGGPRHIGEEALDVADLLGEDPPWQGKYPPMTCGFQVETKLDDEVTPDLFRNWDQYGVVYYTGHGFTVDDSEAGDFLFMTHELATAGPFGTLRKRQKDVYYVHSLTVGTRILEGAEVPDPDFFGVRPVFISRALAERNVKLPNTLVFATGCLSYENESMAKHLMADGAGAYLGYDFPVTPRFAQERAIYGSIGSRGVLEKMSQGMTIAQAFPYPDDGGRDPYYDWLEEDERVLPRATFRRARATENLVLYTDNVIAVQTLEKDTYRPLKDVVVTLSQRNRMQWVGATDADGYLVCQGLRDEEYTLSPKLPGYAFEPSSETVTAGPNPLPHPVQFMGHRTSVTLAGRVLEAETRSVPNVTIEAQGSGGSQTATTDSTGAYALTLPAGEYTVTPTAPGYTFDPPNKSVTLRSDLKGVNFDGRREGTFRVAGTVRGSDGNVIEGEGITLWASDGKFGGYDITQMDGSYLMLNVPAGQWTVETSISYWYYEYGTRDITVESDMRDVDLTLDPRVHFTIHGTVSGASGVTVTARDNRGKGSFERHVITDGAWEITGLPLADYALTATKAGYVFSPASYITWAYEPNDPSFDFTATQAYHLSGTVKVGKNPIEGVTVGAAGDAGSGTAQTDAGGSYHLDGLAAGTYNVAASKPGYDFTGPGSVNIPETTTANFTGTVQRYQISGRVTECNRGVAGVVLDGFEDAQGRPVTTDVHGDYTIPNLEPGTYIVMPRKEGYVFYPSRRDVTLATEDRASVGFVAQRPVTLTGLQGRAAGGNAANPSLLRKRAPAAQRVHRLLHQRAGQPSVAVQVRDSPDGNALLEGAGCTRGSAPIELGGGASDLPRGCPRQARAPPA